MFKTNQQANLTTRNRRDSKEIKKSLLFGNQMEARNEHQTTKRFNTLFYTTTILGVTIFVVMLIWVFAFRGGLSGRSHPDLEFNWHPLLMFFGMILLYSQAILLYRSRRYDTKRRLKLAHAGVHFSIIFLTIFGLITAFDSHNLAVDKPNLYTMHSWLGLTTVIAFCLQYVVGFACFLFPGFTKDLRATLLPAHVNIGTAIFILASFTALMGFCEKAIFSLSDKYKRFPPEGYLVNTLAMLTALFSVLTLYLVNEREYKRENVPEDEIALTRNE
ncbi:transmembrane ascorbate-dependent reductase CYB561 isoform X2 [Onthophagus taurus]|uniref:transmembrane ascorbate-dependent reductase CYB561 isoform X2 n=1 Tax=Onthophagus taurus TaxID=166361 RepID=UPI000C20D81F|nr:cytochrome b561 isoform X2 [Onthophagus taurus]